MCIIEKMTARDDGTLPAGISDSSMFLFRKIANPASVDFRQRPKHDTEQHNYTKQLPAAIPTTAPSPPIRPVEPSTVRSTPSAATPVAPAPVSSISTTQQIPNLRAHYGASSSSKLQNTSNTSVLRQRMAALSHATSTPSQSSISSPPQPSNLSTSVSKKHVETPDDAAAHHETFHRSTERNDSDRGERGGGEKREKKEKKHKHRKHEDDITRRRKQDALLDLIRLGKRCNLSRQFTMDDSYSEIAHERDRHQIELDISDQVSTGKNYVLAAAMALFLINRFLGNKIALNGWLTTMKSELDSGSYDSVLEQLYRSMHKSGPPSITSSMANLFIMTIIGTHISNKLGGGSKQDVGGGETQSSTLGGGLSPAPSTGGGFNIGSIINMLGGLVSGIGGGGGASSGKNSGNVNVAQEYGAGPSPSSTTTPPAVLPKQRIIKAAAQ